VSTEEAVGSVVGGLTVLTLVKESYKSKRLIEFSFTLQLEGTGLLLGQVLKDLGAHTLGTVRTKEKRILTKEAGYEPIIECCDPQVTSDVGVCSRMWKLSLST